MSGVWGKHIKCTIFGESHGKAIGMVIEGLPPGIELDFPFINKELARRAPGRHRLGTSRQETDAFQILSGYFQNKTTGTPLACVIENKDQKSRDYTEGRTMMRPGHADYTGYIKYKGANDYRGGGHFSGRLTAPLVFAGAVAKQLLLKKNILIGSHIKSISNVCDKDFSPLGICAEKLLSLEEMVLPVLDDDKGLEMENLILLTKEQHDSVGGIVETMILNCPAGLGEPFFESVESRLAQLLFAIPAVKGVEFGAGFALSNMKGSEANDEYYYEGEKLKTFSNHNGGILGGISNGMPVLFRTAFKPTPSIGQKQRTVDIEKRLNTELQIKGRHDPCIVPRAVVVVEAAAALVFLDLLIEWEGKEWIL